MKTITESIERLRAELDAESRKQATAFYTNPKFTAESLKEIIDLNHSVTSKPGRKYTKINIGTSGAFMVNMDTGVVHGIKGYGVIHPKVIHGSVHKITGVQLLPRRYIRAGTAPIQNQEVQNESN